MDFFSIFEKFGLFFFVFDVFVCVCGCWIWGLWGRVSVDNWCDIGGFVGGLRDGME